MLENKTLFSKIYHYIYCTTNNRQKTILNNHFKLLELYISKYCQFNDTDSKVNPINTQLMDYILVLIYFHFDYNL